MLNQLPGVKQDEFQNNLMAVIGNEKKFELFDCEAVRDMIEYKWYSHCGIIHYVGATVHFVLVVMYSAYIIQVYCHKDVE